MNNNDNHSSSPPDDGKELLEDLMPKLGMETTEPKGKYKSQARTRYLLPRLLTAAVVIAAVVFLGFYLTRPAQFYNVNVEESPESVEVDFDVDRLLLLESVTATLDGQPAAVTREKMGSYQATVQKNGELIISARTFTGRESQQTVSIRAIDDEPPHMTGSDREDGEIYIYFTDEGGSGINWDSVQATAAESGEPFDLGGIDREAGCVHFPFPDKSVRIYLEDNNENPLSVLLTLLEEEVPALHE